MGKRKPFIDIFLSKFEVPEDRSECWIWQGIINPRGYGRINKTLPDGSQTQLMAHRVSYEFFVGPIPLGYQVDHLCHNQAPSCVAGDGCSHRACVNPTHLEAVTPKVNSARAAGKRGCCLNGHRYLPETTYVTPDGRRVCKICRRVSGRKHDAKRRLRG